MFAASLIEVRASAAPASRLFPPLPPTVRPLLGHLAGADLWRAALAVCDTVMGGASFARLRVPPGLDEESGAVFEGTVRADGGGGFATVRAPLAPPAALEAADCDALLLHVRGDGRRYSLRAFAAPGRGLRGELAFEARFSTTRGEAQEVFVPLRALRARWRGADVAGAPPPRSCAELGALGFMATTGEAGLGDFALECMGIYGVREDERQRERDRTVAITGGASDGGGGANANSGGGGGGGSAVAGPGLS